MKEKFMKHLEDEYYKHLAEEEEEEDDLDLENDINTNNNNNINTNTNNNDDDKFKAPLNEDNEDDDIKKFISNFNNNNNKFNPNDLAKDNIILNANDLSMLSAMTVPRRKKNENLKHVIILIPMTIPGNGKTFFINQLKPIIEENGISFYTIGSDNIRRKIMDSMIRYKGYSEKMAFEKSGFPAGKEFEKQLGDIVIFIISIKNLNKIFYMYLFTKNKKLYKNK